MRTKIIIIVIISFFTSNFLGAQNPNKDWNSLIEKYNSSWGEPCKGCIYNEDIFQVSMRNIGTENVDVLIAVQESNKSWRCDYNENIAPNDTIVGFACKGTGKYLKWVRKAGDRELEFPTCAEVNKQYRE